MKKSLLLILAMTLCASLIAQQAPNAKVAVKINNAAKTEKSSFTMSAKTSNDEWNSPKEVLPPFRTSPLLMGDGQLQLAGETFFNRATNGFARNTVSFREDSNDAAAAWIIGTVASTDRGTGINYYNTDDNAWGPIPSCETGRIEKQRTGWGSHAFTEEGEIVVAHSVKDGLVISTRPKWGEGEWTENLLKAPPYKIQNKTDTQHLLWPTVTAVGNTVHLLAVTESSPTGSINYDESDFPNLDKWGYKGYITYPLYYRSTDGGLTWEDPVDFGPAETGGLGLMDEYETFKFSGDDYVITAKGDHVVILFSTIWGMVYYLESFDGGVTWGEEKKDVFKLKDRIFLTSWEEEVSWQLLPRSGAVAIETKDNGEADVVHVAFSTVMDHWTPGKGIAPYWKWPVGLIYWNSSMEEIDSDTLKGEVIGEGDDAELIEHFLSHSGYIALPSIIGAPHFFCLSDGPGYDRDQFADNGWAAFPRIIAENGRVFISYQAPLDHPVSFSQGTEALFCRGLFVTVSDDGGTTWDAKNNTSWMTYHPELLWMDWKYYDEKYWPKDSSGWILWYPTLIENMIEIITENGFPSMSRNTNNNSLMLQWLNHSDKPFSNDPDAGAFDDNEIYVFTMTQNLDSLPWYNNVQRVIRGEITTYPRLFDICDNDSEVTIVWDPPFIAAGIEYYEVWRDSVLIGEVSVDLIKEYKKYFFIDIDPSTDTVFYQVSTNVSGSMSAEWYYVMGHNYLEDGCMPEEIINNVKETPAAPKVKLYPNPANGNVTIAVDANSPYTLTITNVMGQVVSSMKGSSNRVNLNLSNFAPGVYIVNVKTAGSMTSQKLIVK